MRALAPERDRWAALRTAYGRAADGLRAGLATLLVWTAAAPERAVAESMPVVVELYTSQGCAMCPPADEMLYELAKYDNVIALALHVDYWDYLGWTDSFARPEHTVRQKAYARTVGERMIYTPQMIVGGTEQVLGGRAMQVMAAIQQQAEQSGRVPVTLVRSGNRLAVQAPAMGGQDEPLVVQLVLYRPQATVEILRGENAGRTFTYTNIVTAWDEVATWSGAEPLSLELDVPGDAPAVLIVQRPDHGAIMGAASAR